MTVYYVDPRDGDDSADGTSEGTAFKTLTPVSQDGDVELKAGDEVLVKDNEVLNYDTKLDLSIYAGEENNYISIQGFQQSKPILDFGGIDRNGIDMYGCQFVKLADFEIRNIGKNAIRCNGLSDQDAQSCVFQDLKIHDYGITDEWAGNGLIFYGNSYDHVVKNCTAYRGHTANHSDGFYIGGTMDNMSGGHTFRDCVAYRNADDGFDCYRADPDRPTLFRGCVAYKNGSDGEGNTGDGNGFKLAGGWKTGGNIAQFCVAYDNTARGFDANGGSEAITFQHCTSFRNGTYGFQFTGDTDPDHIAQNCLAWKNKKANIANEWNVISGNNSWDLSIGDPLFRNTNPSMSQFLRLSQDSPAVDVGVDVGLRFSGKAPDLGAYEYQKEEGDNGSNGGAGTGDGDDGDDSDNGSGDSGSGGDTQGPINLTVQLDGDIELEGTVTTL